MKHALTGFGGACLVLLLTIFSGGVTPAMAQHRIASIGQQQERALSTIMDEIATYYTVSIIYDTEQLSSSRTRNWQLSNQSAEYDLNRALRHTNFSFQKLNATTFVIKKQLRKPSPNRPAPVTSSKPPVRTINAKGTILDIDNEEPLIGVNITVDGTGTGTVTDFEGNFSIVVEEGSVLVMSYLGYLSQEITVEKANLGIIRMTTNARQLEEVVVVGYGSQKRSDLTGALSSVSEREIKQLPNTGLDQALQGRAAGVFITQNSGAPGGGVSVRIRGIGSTLTAEPLYVIDGIPVVNDNQGTSSNFAELDGGGQNSNALNTINPSDIESIEILKDASATAIYGARAANGVVIITTKRGAAGRSSIAFESFYGVQEIAKKVPVLNLQEYAEYYDAVGWETIEEFQRPELLGEGTDWQDAVFRQAAMQNYQLTVSGGNKQTRYALSGGYHYKEGIVVGSDFNRFSTKINLDHSFSDRVRLGNSLLVSRTEENITFNSNSQGVVYTGLLMVPNAPVRNADGSFAGPQEEITLSFDNPVARALETNDVNRKTRLLANLYLEADILKNLTYRTEVGTDLIFSNNNTFFPSFSRGNFFGKSGVRERTSNNRFWINKHLLTYKQTIAQRHHLTTLVGFEAQAGQYEWLFASRENLPNNQLESINLGDLGQQQTNGGSGHWALMSWFGRLNYNFDERWLVTGTVRVDGSSRFGPNNRYGVFPSGAVAWRLSQEKFLQDVEALDNLKLRVGVGEVGNQEIGLYSYLANLRAIGVAQGDNLITGFIPDNIAKPDVRWESSFQSNIGLDVGLFKNRIELVADYYVKRADGMLLPALLPATAGSLTPPFVNIGEIENRGIELALRTVNVTGPFEWRSSVNFTRNRNAVVNLVSTGSLVGLIQSLPVTRTEENQPISQFYGYVMEGIFQSQDEVAESAVQADGTRAGDVKFADLNNDGVINEEDQTFLGSPLPDFTLNMTQDFSYKGFSLSVFFQGVFGNKVLNLVRRDSEGLAGLNNQLRTVMDRYTPENPSNTIPRNTNTDPNNNRRISTRFIEDASFIRLKNITLSYSLPAATLERIHCQQIRIYVSAQNLQTWTDYSGYDPEIGSFNQNPIINGVDNGRYPIARSVTFGLNANF